MATIYGIGALNIDSRISVVVISKTITKAFAHNRNGSYLTIMIKTGTNEKY